MIRIERSIFIKMGNVIPYDLMRRTNADAMGEFPEIKCLGSGHLEALHPVISSQASGSGSRASSCVLAGEAGLYHVAALTLCKPMGKLAGCLFMRKVAGQEFRQSHEPRVWGNLYPCIPVLVLEKKTPHRCLFQVAGLGFPGLDRQGRRTQDLQVIRWSPKTGALDRLAGFPRVALRFSITQNPASMSFSYPIRRELTWQENSGDRTGTTLTSLEFFCVALVS